MRAVPRCPPQLNLRRLAQVSPWNAMFFVRDTALSAVLRRVGVRVAASEVTPGSGRIRGDGYTFYLSDHPQRHLEGALMAVVPLMNRKKIFKIGR